ncbi:tRNA pseudouridine(38-40) synthase TruA [Oricola cellulosilytica]|uniref:tRNA pseudouridine synthase A n=1 Tax=Oricola cellulosilytica TaxID=1429082 RepID=A0A4R0PF63_9HYPH|nr:tRNA pseudouridine(38-40) synthase TruA [Oricola cellulosilytica]TCD16467.1 tRNA pseudouridine(38-40) synthase TruA [Oricola cellulosilytica]
MPRYRLTVEYDGTPYVGFQRQRNGYAVQEAIERAIGKFTQEDVTLHVAGRTDTGVHALGQVCHVDLARDWGAIRVMDATNAHLLDANERVAVIDVEKMDETFHARFSATTRHYLYRIINRHAPIPLERERAWWVKKPLDVEAMQDAAWVLIGTHDFTTFRAAQCQSKSPVKTLDEVSFSRSGELVEVRLSARSFLHNQVRSIVGTLKLVGEGRWTKEDVSAALNARVHQRCGALAPSHGLYLTRVGYDHAFTPLDTSQPIRRA